MDPLHQFAIYKIFNCSLGKIDISFTNASFFMVFITAALCALLHFGSRKRALIPSKGQLLCEEFFHFISSLITDIVGKDGLKYTPYVFSLFLFILGSNLMGLLPYSFTVTSHFAVTFPLALLVFLGTSCAGLIRNKWHFFRVFCPEGTPTFLKPLLIPIEVISYMMRPFSLSLRLCVNMIAGHIVLKLLASAAPACLSMPYLQEMPILIVIGGALLFAFETFVACLQTYIFVLFSCVYLNGSLHPE